MSAPYLKNPFLLKRGTTAKVAAYSGPEGELVIDTTKGTIAVQTGTSGGVVLARLSDIPNKLSQLQNDTNYVTLEGVKQDYMPKADAVSTFDVNGTTITYTKADGTTGTIVTQDTTYSAGTGLNLSNTTFSVASTAGSSALSWGTEVTLGTVGGLAIKAKLPANPNTDTHYTTKLIVGVSDSTANAAATNGNLYLRLFDNTTARNSIKLVGAGKTTVTSDANGVITISSSDANTTYSAGTGLDLSGTTFSVVSTAGTSTLAWNSEVTLGTVGGLAIKAKLPANPNTDKLVAQNIVSGNATYPILLAATADATANIGAKAVQFASGVKINPSTATIIATTFDGTASRAVADANGKNIATTYAAKTEVPTKLSQLSNDTNFVAQGEAATKATNDENGNAITSYIRELSVSGRVITYTKGDNTTGTITTQDTNTDTLVAQNISTANAAYPILLGATADATANIGNKAALFASGVKINPSTSTITATTFNGTATRATADANGKNIANTYAAKTAIPTKLSQLSNDTNFVAQGETATNATNDANGNAITGYIKNLSVSGKVITFTKGDNTTGTITTQDTNTDTLVAQNISTANSTYPILLAATANATANIGAKAVQFASGVKVNPSTSTITATTFNGTATRATADANGKNIANTYATKTEVTSLRDGIIVNVTALPTTGESGKIYFLANSSGDAQNAYDEYAWVNNAWESLGPSTLDLAEYSKKNQTVSSFAVSGRTVTFTRADGTTGTFTTQDSNTWTAFKGATTDAAGTAGYVPAPAKGAANRYFRSDGTWQVPPNTWTAMVGATSSANGSVGYVNAVPPKDGYNTKYLRADGAWVVPPNTNTTYSAGTGLSLSGTTFSVVSTAGTSALSWNTEVTLATVGGMAIKAKLPTNPNTNTWIAFKGATTDAAGTAGYMPAPAAGAANRYFRSDGTWQVPPNTTYSNMTAATASAAGKAGLVPAPAAGKQTSFLRGDGTWVVPTNTTYSAGTGLALSGTTFSVSSTAGTSTLAWNSEVTLYTVGGAAIKAKLPANPNTDTHWTTKLIAGVSDSTANAASTNGNTYLRLFDNSTARNSIKLVGAGKTTVTSDANGVITITSTDANTTYANMTGATADAAGKAGLVPAPAAGKQTSFLRGDGTWVVPTNTWTAMKGATSSANGTAGYVPAPPTAGYNTKYLRADGTWQVPPDTNTTYSFTDKNVTLAWGTKSTIATVGGTDIHVTMPANPNTWPTKTSQLTNDSGFLTAHQSLANYVTLNSVQIISGGKAFTGGISGINKNNSTEDANTLYSDADGSIMLYYTTANGSTKLTNLPAAVNSSLISYTVRHTSATDYIVHQILHNSNGLYYRTCRDGTWGGWKAFAFTDGSITGNAATATKLATARSIFGTSFDGSANVVSSTIQLVRSDITKGTNPSDATKYWSLGLYDKNGTNYTNNCLGIFETSITQAGVVSTYMRAITNTAGSSTACQISCIYDTANNLAYTAAPTPADNDNTTKIATTAWVQRFCGTTKKYLTSHQSLAGYLPLTTNVSELGRYIDMHYDNGTKKYDYDVRFQVNSQGTAAGQGQLQLVASSFITGGTITVQHSNNIMFISKNTAMTVGTEPSKNLANVEIIGQDNAGKSTWGIYHQYYQNKTNQVQLIAYKGSTQDDAWAGIGVGFDAGGNSFTIAPTPADNDNTTKIATTAWVQKFCGTTKKYLTGITKAQVTTALGYTPPTTNTTYSFSDKNVTLQWGTKSTIATVGGTDIHVTMPANPNTNTDTLVTQNVSNTNAVYPILLCPTASATANQGAKTSIFSQCTCVNASNGSIEIVSALPYVTLRDTRYARSATAPTAASSCAFTIHDANNKSLAAFGYDIQANAKHSTAFMRAYLSTTTSDSDYATVLLYRDNSSGSSVSAFVCGTTKGTTLGDGNHLWKQLYASTATINTSDEREKDFIDDIPDAVLDAWGDVSFKQFKMKDAIEEKGVDVARYHTGLIAQQIDSIFSKKDLDAAAYGLFCYDSWEAEDASYDENGNETAPAREAGDQYALRYEEALCVEAAYQRRRADRAERRLAFVEERLAAIESKLDI